MKRLTLLLVASLTGCSTVWNNSPSGTFLVTKAGLPKACREIHTGARSGILGHVQTWKLGKEVDLAACGIPSQRLVDELKQQLDTTRDGSRDSQKRINELENELKKAQLAPDKLQIEAQKNRIKDLENLLNEKKD